MTYLFWIVIFIINTIIITCLLDGLIIGIAMIVYGILLFAFEKTQLEFLTVIGVVELLISIAVGMAVSFYAMKKYNGGIF